jgi:YggT family protein
MMLLAQVIGWVIQVFILIVVLQAVLSYFMDPYHPLRQNIDRIVNPFLAPIRRILPPIGGLDFSPLVLVIVLSILGRIIYQLLLSL